MNPVKVDPVEPIGWRIPQHLRWALRPAAGSVVRLQVWGGGGFGQINVGKTALASKEGVAGCAGAAPVSLSTWQVADNLSIAPEGGGRFRHRRVFLSCRWEKGAAVSLISFLPSAASAVRS